MMVITEIAFSVNSVAKKNPCKIIDFLQKMVYIKN
jgi:hypothetical protein